jgi:hypothetical protein
MNNKRITRAWLPLVLIVLLTQTLAVSAAKKDGLPFKGSLAGSETDTFTPPNSIMVEGSGSGNATHLGLFTIDFEVIVDLSTGAGPANAQLVSANGDSLFCEGSGQATETGTPGLVIITESYTITGGTGRLAKASGGFTVVRQVNLITGDTSGTFDGKIFLR